MNLNTAGTAIYSSNILATLDAEDFDVYEPSNHTERLQAAWGDTTSSSSVGKYLFDLAIVKGSGVRVIDRGRSVTLSDAKITPIAKYSTSTAPMAKVDSKSNDASLKISALLNTLYRLSKDGNDVDLLKAAFGEVEKSIAQGDLDFVNGLLEQMDLTRIKNIASIGLARVTARARAQLPAWRQFVVGVWTDLSSKHSNAQHLMRGLVPANDSTLFAAKQSIT